MVYVGNSLALKPWSKESFWQSLGIGQDQCFSLQHNKTPIGNGICTDSKDSGSRSVRKIICIPSDMDLTV